MRKELRAGGRLVAIATLLFVLGTPTTANAVGEYAYSPLTLVNGASYTNKQLVVESGFCKQGIFDIYHGSEALSAANSGALNASKVVTGISSDPVPSYATIFATYGAGYYLFTSNNSLGCTGIIEIASGGAYMYANIIDASTTIAWDGLTYSSSSPLYASSTFSSFFNPAFQTRFINASTSSSSLSFSYFIKGSEVVTSDSSKNPTHFRVVTTKESDSSETFFFDTLSTTTDAIATSTLSISALSDATYTARISFSNVGAYYYGATVPFADTYMTLRFTKSGSTITLLDAVVINTPQEIIPYTLQECSLTNLSGCISNSLSYLFIPSPSAISSIGQLQATLATKFPFAYAYDGLSAITAVISTNASHNTSLSIPLGAFGSIPVISTTSFSSLPQASLIRGFLVGFLWLMFSIQMYRRTLKIFNPAPL